LATPAHTNPPTTLRDLCHQGALAQGKAAATAAAAARPDFNDSDSAPAATKDWNSVGGVTAEVAAADDVSTAAAEEYAAYLEGQRHNGWKD